MDDVDRDFYQGHVEVVPQLYRKRLHALCDWESPLERVQRQDDLFEVYLGILEQGRDDALEVAREHARPDVPGSYFAAASLACRLGRFEVMREILGELEAACGAPGMMDEAAASLRHAIGDALVRYLPKTRVERVLEALRTAGPHEAAVLARWLGGLGGDGVVEGLREAMRRQCAERAAVLRALGQASGVLPPEVREAIDDPDPVVAQTAAIVALRRGDASVLERLAAMPPTPWAAVPMAMGGGLERWPWLLEATRAEEPSQALLALGILGEPTAVEVLLEHVHEPSHASAAAIGLFLLTGTKLAELEPTRAMPEGPRALDGGPGWMALHGSGISTDPAAWTRWRAERIPRLQVGRRHRLGTRAWPKGDLRLLSWRLPLWLRRCIADEVAIRYGVLRWGYEPDRFVDEQRKAIARVRMDHERELRDAGPGSWWFDGRESVEMKAWSQKLREQGVNAR